MFTVLLWVCLVCLVLVSYAQNRRERSDSLFETQDSRNGYILPVKGHLHVLVIFAEVDYENGADPSPNGTKDWNKGKLPVWKDDLFDPNPTKQPRSIVSSFFYEASFGNYIVTGDYLINPENSDAPVTVTTSGRVNSAIILEAASSSSGFSTRNNFQIRDFDKWTLTHIGHPKKTPSVDNPARYDHIMIIVRNATYPSNLSGWTSSRSAGRLFGYESDTYSIFCTQKDLPFNILLHEYSHMLFGGNNFHAGGSHSKKAGYSYFPHIQCGWGMMGAAWKSFLTVNAWERRRLGWKNPEKTFYISTLDSTGTFEVNTDLDPENHRQEGFYLIRDFVTSGDAIRIRLPQLKDDVFQQWLWIENHQTSSMNNSRFDRFQYEDQDCMDNSTPGLYMYIQVDKEEIKGKNIYGGYADYLRPLPANGLWDIVWGDTAVQNPWCINNHHYYPHRFLSSLANPFSGSHEMELVFNDFNNNGQIETEEYRVPAIRQSGFGYQINLPVLGAKEHAFTSSGKKRIGLDTNPSSCPVLTSVSATGDLFPEGKPNNRTVFLNGISVTIHGYSGKIRGAILVQIKFDDYNIRQRVRWCADTIVFNPMTTGKQQILTVHKNGMIHIDRGLTPSRMTNPEPWKKKILYSKPTVFVMMPGTTLYLKENSKILIDNGSTMIVMSGAVVRMDKKSSISVINESGLIFMPGSTLQRQKGSRIKVSTDSTFEVRE